MRGNLSDEQLTAIRQRVPRLDPRFSHMLAAARSTEEYAVFVRLMDAGARLEAMILALVEAYACLMWYRELAPPAEYPMAEIVSTRLYTDHVALLQYAADEDLAAFIRQFCRVQAVYKDFESHNPPDTRWSEAMRVERFLRATLPHDPVTEPFFRLHTNQDWQAALAYRNAWVHHQPPLLKGLGLQQSRQDRMTSDGISITFGGGAEPALDIDQVLQMVHAATTAFAMCFSTLLDIVLLKTPDALFLEHPNLATYAMSELGMRGRLPDDQLTRINQRLPTLDSRFPVATWSDPFAAFYDITHPPRKTHIALVCLTDAGYHLAEIRYGLNEAYACLDWYRQFAPDAPQETLAVVRTTFYIDHVTLLQFAIAEDLAAFIIDFLGIATDVQTYTDVMMQQGNPHRITSSAAILGTFLRDHYPDDSITKATERLRRDPAWRKAMKYRNDWVHEQPPQISGRDTSATKASWDIDDLLITVHTATTALVTCFSSFVDVVVDWRTGIQQSLTGSTSDKS